MDWYFGSDGDDLVVPRDHEPSLDRLLSSEKWMQWGITAPECFVSSNKYLVKGKNPCERELSLDMDMDGSANDRVHSRNSSMCDVQWTLPYEWPDYQINDLVGVDQMEDIFLNSILDEDMTGVEYVNGSFCYSPESQHNSFPAGSKKEDVAMLCLDLSNSRQRDNTPGKAPVMKVPVASEQNCINGVGGATSMEESVLQDLETAMTQLSDQTRICFRDALYRLAKNSRVNQGQNGELIVESAPPWTVLDETSGLRAAELETNTIDRAVASLVFNKIDHNAQDVSAAASPDFKPEATGTRGPFNCSFDEEQICHFPCTTSSADDAEVPTFGEENLFTTTNLHRYASGAANML